MHTLTFPILRVLADGAFHSGEALASHFKVSRATIWNAMQTLETLGVTIFSVRGRGYKLPQPLALLNGDAIQNKLRELGNKTDFKLEVHDSLGSTNSYLMQHASTTMHRTCVATNLQTQGRGRRGRTWKASLGASLTFSLLWRFQCGASGLSGLSLAVGVALMRCLIALGVQNAQLKWPNDLLITHEKQAQKLAGILIELQGDMEGPSAAVIGIGLNLDLSAQMKVQIDQPTTDLKTALGDAFNPNLTNPNDLLAIMLKHLAEVLSQFEQQGFASLREEWLSHHAYHEKPVKLLHPDGRETHGVVRGIAEDGVLLVETAQGVQRFMSGEISLRAQ